MRIGVGIIIIILFLTVLIIYCTCRFSSENFNSKLNLCLTTIPSRLENIDKVLDSFLKQTILPDNIFLMIPYKSIRNGKEYKIPERISNYVKQNPRIKILRCQDYGPGTKLLGYIENNLSNDDEIIIIVDDDKYYNNNTIEVLLKTYKKNKDSIVSGRVSRQNGPGYLAEVPWGNRGILIHRSMIKDDIFDVFNKLKDSCMFVDDMLWYKYFKELHKINIIEPSMWSVVTKKLNEYDALHKQGGDMARGGENGLQARCFNSKL